MQSLSLCSPANGRYRCIIAVQEDGVVGDVECHQRGYVARRRERVPVIAHCRVPTLLILAGVRDFAREPSRDTESASRPGLSTLEGRLGIRALTFASFSELALSAELHHAHRTC